MIAKLKPPAVKRPKRRNKRTFDQIVDTRLKTKIDGEQYVAGYRECVERLVVDLEDLLRNEGNQQVYDYLTKVTIGWSCGLAGAYAGLVSKNIRDIESDPKYSQLVETAYQLRLSKEEYFITLPVHGAAELQRRMIKINEFQSDLDRVIKNSTPEVDFTMPIIKFEYPKEGFSE